MSDPIVLSPRARALLVRAREGSRYGHVMLFEGAEEPGSFLAARDELLAKGLARVVFARQGFAVSYRLTDLGEEVARVVGAS